MIIYSYLEISLIAILNFRVYCYSRDNFNVVKSNFEILLYIFAIFIDSLASIIFGENNSVTIIFDVIFPLTIIIPILARQKSKSHKFLLLLFIPISYFAFMSTNEAIRYLLYILCMAILFVYSIILTLGSGHTCPK